MQLGPIILLGETGAVNLPLHARCNNSTAPIINTVFPVNLPLHARCNPLPVGRYAVRCTVNLPLHARCNGKAAFLLEDSTSISCTFCMQRLAACTVYLVQDYLFCKIAENLVESFPTARHVSDYGHFLGLRRYSPPKIRVRRSYGFYEDFPFALICFIVS